MTRISVIVRGSGCTLRFILDRSRCYVKARLWYESGIVVKSYYCGGFLKSTIISHLFIVFLILTQ